MLMFFVFIYCFSMSSGTSVFGQKQSLVSEQGGVEGDSHTNLDDIADDVSMRVDVRRICAALVEISCPD